MGKNARREYLNAIYTTEWRLLMNFFLPSTKLVEKYLGTLKINQANSTGNKTTQSSLAWVTF